MGTRYSSQSASGYNASPPPDDGSISASNQITWGKIKSKLADALKTLADGINSQLVTALDQSSTAQSSAYTTLVSDRGKPILVTGTTTISLGTASAMGTDYTVPIVNAGTAVVTVNLATGTDTLNGLANGSVTLAPGQTMTFATNTTPNGYNVVAGAGFHILPLSSVSGTNTITANASPKPGAYAANMFYSIIPANTNTGATTLNVSSLGARNVYKNGAACVGGELKQSVPAILFDDGTQLNIVGLNIGPATSSGLTMNTARILGRTTASSGAIEEISVSGATLSGGILTIVGPITTVSSITSSATLTASSAGYQSIAMSSLAQSVTLPDATTMTVGGPRFILDNTKGTYPAGIRDNTGVLLMAVAAGGEAYVSLKDSSTQAGVWSVTGSNLEPGLTTIDSTFSSTYTSTTLTPFVALDSNKSIHFLSLASNGFAAVAVDNSTGAVGTPLTITTTASSVPKHCFKISSTTAIVFYGEDNNTLRAAVISLSGATTLAVGTAANSGANTGIAVEDFLGAPKIAQLASGLYLVSWATATGAGNTSVMAISVSGTTVTFGSKADIITSNNVASSTTTYALTATTALVLYKSGAGAPYANNGVVISVSGTTCTVGTPAAATSCQSSQIATCSSAFLSATKIAIADDNNTTQVTVSGFTISGTTVTAWTALNVETGLATNLIEYTTNNATRYNPHLWALGSNTAGFWYLDGSGVSRAVVLTESSGTVTAGTKLYSSFSSNTSNTNRSGTVIPQGTSDFFGLTMYGTANAWKFAAIPHKISGTNITYGDITFVPELSSINVMGQLNATRLSSSDYLIFGAEASAIPVFRSNGDSINKRGSIAIPTLSIGVSYPLQSVSSNRIVLINGTTGTTVGASTYQLRLLNIEVAQ